MTTEKQKDIIGDFMNGVWQLNDRQLMMVKDLIGLKKIIGNFVDEVWELDDRHLEMVKDLIEFVQNDRKNEEKEDV